MGIPIRPGRRPRRSYADYQQPTRKTGRRNDPFRIVFYVVAILAVVWLLRNPTVVTTQLGQIVDFGIQVQQSAGPAGPAPTPSPQPDQFALEAQQAYLDGHIDEAIADYRQAAEFAPNTVDYHFQVARLLLIRSAMEYGTQRTATIQEAMQAANGAILANPESPQGYAIMGKALDWDGRPEEASAQILRALELDENFALGHSYLAEAQVDLQRWEQATETIELAYSLDPTSVDILSDYAYVLESLGDYASAATRYEAAIQIHPRLAYLRMSLGRAYRAIGRYNEALDQFFETETLAPENALVNFEIGRTYETYIGDPTTALEYYQRAVEIDAEYATPWLRIGTLHYLQESYDLAIPAFEQALALGLDTVDIYTQLGLSYAHEGQCVEALSSLQQAQTLAEGDERILDLIDSGFELCNQALILLTPGATPSQTP